MKIQVRMSVLTFQWEVQTCEEGKSVWTTRASLHTEEEARKCADELRKTLKERAAAAKENKPKAPKAPKAPKDKGKSKK